MKQLGEKSGERALVESIVTAYNALMEGIYTPKPASKVYVSADGSQVLGVMWSSNTDNIDDEDYEAGYDCYTLGDLYDVDESFDVSQLPSDPWELEGLEGKGLSLAANLEQRLYKSTNMPSEEDAIGVYVNPEEGWTPVTPKI